MFRKILVVFFWLQLAFHMAMFFMNIGAIFVLPFYSPWYIWAPLDTFLINLMFSTNKDCALTKLENKVRSSLGWRPIGGFFGSYFLKPISKLLGVRRENGSKKEEISSSKEVV